MEHNPSYDKQRWSRVTNGYNYLEWHLPWRNVHWYYEGRDWKIAVRPYVISTLLRDAISGEEKN